MALGGRYGQYQFDAAINLDDSGLLIILIRSFKLPALNMDKKSQTIRWRLTVLDRGPPDWQFFLQFVPPIPSLSLSFRYRHGPCSYHLVFLGEFAADSLSHLFQIMKPRIMRFSVSELIQGGVWGMSSATALETLPVEPRGLGSGVLQQGYAVGYLIAAVINLVRLSLLPSETLFEAD